MTDPRANMEGNNLLKLGAPKLDWSKTPGRVTGFWVSVVSVILAALLPFPALFAALIGLSLSLRAYGVIPAGARGRGLVLASLVLSGAAVLAVAMRLVLVLV
ncbi:MULTISPECIES: hypothetical protein [Cryobacterium]|uniref:DUF4190 domain-containing protein n=1 Tax=Cryobacterium breve TaxID=1259258 RepID=A0ABY2J865_9MICO|nr:MULTISPECIES: hypothetical protein [Cryobacterium]TFC91166.1 hypothetical protein E3T20_14150 [Cryobacterium sp. TmT3-12]TFD01139.1 hypothetical protein E3O65_02265 [Cryobacterium breve]